MMQIPNRDPEATARVTDFVRGWAMAVAPGSFAPFDQAHIERILSDLTSEMIDVVMARREASTVGTRIGQILVDEHFTKTAALAGTLNYLGAQFPTQLARTLNMPTAALRAALVPVLGALASQYCTALQDRTLIEQERVLRAGFAEAGQVDQALRESESRFRAIFEEAAIGIGVADVNGQILMYNRALMKMLGFQTGGLSQQQATDFVHPADGPDVWPSYFELAHGFRDHMQMEKRYLRKDGTVVWTNLVASLIRDSDGNPSYILGMIEDITERREFSERLRHQATHDSLTGLPNRALFFERLDELIAEAKPDQRVGLCFLDLDHFKRTNDTLGHDIGDALLVAFSKRLHDFAAGEGRLVARLASDEFAILIENPRDVTEVESLADEVLQAFQGPLPVTNLKLGVSVSIGVLARDLLGADSRELMKDADLTLLAAKAAGRGQRIRYDADRNERQLNRYRLSAALPDALAAGEFFLDYQPMVDLSTGKWRATEALVRWRHPQFGLIGPGHFIMLAEETGFISILGRWVLEQACQQARQWISNTSAAGPLMSVNLAVRQLHDEKLPTQVEGVLSDTGLAPQHLQLELTESAIISPDDGSLLVVRRLAEMGVQLAIDDFGTGYSNLAYLRHVPVHNLKLAGAFLDGLGTAERLDPVDSQIVTSLVELAHTLGLSVTAEGIETPQQATRLRDVGCDLGQGYLFARPGPPSALDNFQPWRYETDS